MLIYESLRILVTIIEFAILVRIVLSLLNIRNMGVFHKLVYEITEPVLGPSRNLIAKLGLNTGMFDFSPILAIFILKMFLILAAKILF